MPVSLHSLAPGQDLVSVHSLNSILFRGMNKETESTPVLGQRAHTKVKQWELLGILMSKERRLFQHKAF